MTLRLLMALAMGAIVTGACVAGEGTENSTTLPLTTKELLETAKLFGMVNAAFEKSCTNLNPYSWFSSQTDIIVCKAFVEHMHSLYRSLSPKSIMKDNQLLEIGAPFMVGPITRRSANNAQRIYEQQYGLKETSQMFLDKDGKLKQYSTIDRPNELIEYMSSQKQ